MTIRKKSDDDDNQHASGQRETAKSQTKTNGQDMHRMTRQRRTDNKNRHSKFREWKEEQQQHCHREKKKKINNEKQPHINEIVERIKIRLEQRSFQPFSAICMFISGFLSLSLLISFAVSSMFVSRFFLDMQRTNRKTHTHTRLNG